MSDTSRSPGWWRKFRSLPAIVQVASWIGLAVLLIIGAVVGGENSSGTPTAETSTSAPTTSPSTTVALTPLPITLTNADFHPGFSQDLRLSGGVYTLSLTSNKPGPGIGVDVYELRQDCGAVSGIVAGSSLNLGKGDTTGTGATKPLKAGCYQLLLVDLPSATVTVKFAL